jgi:succinate dehydrogenase / fumarate reductase flavoprotein subunit
MAYAAGVPMKDMEFVQFHPTTLLGTNILMTEACRGEGGYLINNKGERFMERYVPKAMELAPRDIVSRSIQTEIETGNAFENELGRYVHLDLRHLGEKKILERLPGIRRMSIDFAGVDPIHEPIPIMPCQHYSMGGIDTNARGETALKGFYAAGECACVSVHGGNRLGGNSLLDTIVFGKISSVSIDDYLSGRAVTPAERVVEAKKEEMERKIRRLSAAGSERPFKVLDDLRKTMDACVGIFRTKGELETGLEKILAIRERYKSVRVSSPALHMNYELIGALELESMIDVAHATTLGALLREESRGAHFRRDFTKRNDRDWLTHTLVAKDANGEPSVSYRPPVITRYQPMERVY